MTRFKLILAALALAAFTAAGAMAQTVHVVGVGSSAQFNPAGIGADYFAYQDIAQASGGNLCAYHYTAKNAANLVDLRDTRIQQEIGNIWVVWTAQPDSGPGGSCTVTGSTVGGTGVQDIWIDESVDSTVGVRGFMAQESTGAGAQLQIVASPGAAANLIGQALWIDNQIDVTNLPTAVVNAIGQSAPGVHVNLGLTDIRPEDAYYATTRAYGTLNTTTWAGLGYKGVTTKIGAPINTAQGTGTKAVPIGFALEGNDPILKPDTPVRSFVTVTIGAAPIVFVYNNDGDTSYPTNLISGVNGLGTAGGPYYASQLFGGTQCTTNSQAFGGSGSGGNPITVVLREPLSGTMNTTEFNVFRTTGNLDGSQEVGVTNPFNSPYNPLTAACSGGGNRERAIGTGEVVNAVLDQSGLKGAVAQTYPRALGYIFWGWANSNKFGNGGAIDTQFNYLTLDGVDPLGLPASLTGNGKQNMPYCATTNCEVSLWTDSISFPTLRNGTYKAWSMYRWAVPADDTDTYGPTKLAQSAQDHVDAYVADFVPFYSSASNDGMDVYRSHRITSGLNQTTSGCPNTGSGNGAWPSNGSATPAGSYGNTLGSIPATSPVECGSDVGGLIEGPFGVDVTGSGTVNTATTGIVTWKTGNVFVSNEVGTTMTIAGQAYTVTKYTTDHSVTVTCSCPIDASGTVNTATTGIVTWESGSLFGAGMVGSTMTINGSTYTVTKYTSTKSVTVSPDPPKQTAVAYSDDYTATTPPTQTSVDYSDTYTAGDATVPGIFGKKE